LLVALRFLREPTGGLLLQESQVIVRGVEHRSEVGIGQVPGHTIKQFFCVIGQLRANRADPRDFLQGVLLDRLVFCYQRARQEESDLATQTFTVGTACLLRPGIGADRWLAFLPGERT
jgi:hypothetical protein